MRILFLSQRVPFPPDRGDKITTWRIVERLARRHEVRVIAFAHEEGDLEAAAELSRRGIQTQALPVRKRAAQNALSLLSLPTSRPLTLVHYGSRALQRAVDESIEWADLAYAYSSSMAAFLLDHGLPRVMHMAELDSDKWRQYAERESWPLSWIYAREARLLRNFETRVATSFDQNVFCTPLEQRLFQETIPGAPSLVLRNGVDLTRFRPAPERAEARHLVFTGVMDYLPNVDGCLWFADEVFAPLRERYPDARFTIVGSHPVEAALALGERPGITVTGRVPDTADYLARGSISVAPLRIARGIQNKVLEALAMGLPVVGTTSATQGVEGTPGEHFLVADDAEQQLAAIAHLFDSPEDAAALGRRGRAFVEQHYDWERVLLVLDELIAALPPRRRT